MKSNETEIVCPECGNLSKSGEIKRGKCYLNTEKNVWHCFQCGAKGREGEKGSMHDLILRLPEPDGSSSSIDMQARWEGLASLDESGRSYIEKRFGGKLPDFEFKMHESSIAIPIRNTRGELVGIKYRHLQGEPRYTMEKGSQAGFFYVSGRYDQWLICEGEFDALAARAMGFEGVIFAPQTNRLSKQLQAELEKIPKPKRIYLSEDQDEAGSDLGKTVRSLPLLNSADILELHPQGMKDLSELLEHEGHQKATEIFQRLISECKSPLAELSRSASSIQSAVASYLKNDSHREGWSTGFRMLDEKLGGGLMPNTLTALSAPAKTGKTTFVIQMIHNLISKGVQTGFLSLEMPMITHVMPSLYSIHFKKNIRLMEASEIDGCLDGLVGDTFDRLRFLDRNGKVDAALIDQWIRYEAERGTKVFFFDHVGYSLQDITNAGEHSNLSKMLRKITYDYPIHIIPVVQPKHLHKDQMKVSKTDLYGSVTWSQDINALIAVARGTENQLEVRLTDSHDPLAIPGEDPVLLFYDRETCSLSE